MIKYDMLSYKKFSRTYLVRILWIFGGYLKSSFQTINYLYAKTVKTLDVIGKKIP